MIEHIGDSAALYALGALDDAERRAVDAHVAHCASCTNDLARAYDDVATVAAAQPQFAPPGPATRERPRAAAAPRWIAIAAAIALALLPSLFLAIQNAQMHRAMLTDADAMARISSSPHVTVAFTAAASAPGMNAHVMYGRDGSWYCVIVRGATHPLQIVWPHDGAATQLGTATPHGDVALLYLPRSHRMDRLSIVDGDREVAQARLAFE